MRKSRTVPVHGRVKAPPKHAPGHPDTGAVTVETAIIMPGLVLLLAVLLAAAAAGMTTVRYEEAARASARAAARGETSEVVERTAREIAGDTAVVQVSAAGDRVTVAVSASAGTAIGWARSGRLSARTQVPASR